LGGDPRSIIASGLLATRLHLARGEHVAAEAALEEPRSIAADAQFPEWRAELERCQVELWLAQGRLREAVAWSDEALARDADALPDQEPVSLALARVLAMKGDSPARDHALRRLDPLIVKSEAEGRTGLRIAALALRALALSARGDTAGALAALEPALRLASPDGYVRSFIDLGLPMARLLQEAAARGVMPEYIGGLLAAFGEAALVPGQPASRLPEPLSERELEVLNSIAAGLTNREIADALFISPETVKKHTGSIYGKLGVRGRTQAVARARALDLLG
jgi:LuxR family maltose regulon positive regulatory protein